MEKQSVLKAVGKFIKKHPRGTAIGAGIAAGTGISAGVGAATAPKGEKLKGALIGTAIGAPGAYLYHKYKKGKKMEKKAAGKASMLRKVMPYAATAIGAGAVAGGAGYASGASTERKKGTKKARRAFRVGARYGRYRGRSEGRRVGHREAANVYRERAQSRAIKKLQSKDA